jgi:type I restriction enzyme M protein
LAVKKTELYSTLWASCDELRGGIEPSIYKDYVLLILFVKYVTDKAPFSKGQIVIPKGGGFNDLVALKNKPNIGEEINKAISKLASANQLEGIIDVADFNNDSILGAGQLKVDKLSGLIGVFENPNLNFANNRADGDDILGDAYEYLMMKFSIESGKSKAQFYTPAEVSQIMSYMIGIDKATDGKQTIYDPTCGSGSLLLKAHDTALTNTGYDLAIYGQELADNTASLARMNMWLHNVTTSQINSGLSTISNPHFTDKKNPNALRTFDYVVANPPFSTSNWRSGFVPEQDVFGRFEGFGMPPEKNGDYAFLLHIIGSLKSNGTGAVILPHGVLFRGNAESLIRKNLIDKRLIKAVVGLPANLFYGTGIPACIVVIDKKDTANRNHIFMIDASKGFTKNGNKNKLRNRDTHKILDVYKNEEEIPGYSRKVPLSEISNKANDFNLNLPRYIDSSEKADIQNIEAHILGGIPESDIDALESYWSQFPSLRNELIKANARKGFVDLKVSSSEVNSLINSNKEVEKFKRDVHAELEKWITWAKPVLAKVDEKSRPKVLIDELGEKILEVFKPTNLIDAYAIYQGLREYWDETLKDDIYTIIEMGWLGSSKPVKLAPKAKDRVDYQIKKEKFHSETLPSDVLIGKFFSKEAHEIEALEEALNQAGEALDNFDAEYGGDEGLLRDYLNDKGRISKKDLSKFLRDSSIGKEELEALKIYEGLAEKEDQAKESKKEKEAAFVDLIAKQYGSLTEQDVKNILIDNKWLKAIREVVENELENNILRLSKRLSELNERYLVPLPKIQREREELTAKVQAHIEKMGVKWEL